MNRRQLSGMLCEGSDGGYVGGSGQPLGLAPDRPDERSRRANESGETEQQFIVLADLASY
jgi:hypothetical protein